MRCYTTLWNNVVGSITVSGGLRSLVASSWNGYIWPWVYMYYHEAVLPSRSHYGSCPSVCASVLLLTSEQKTKGAGKRKIGAGVTGVSTFSANRCTNIDDLERPWNRKGAGFSEFFAISGCDAHLKNGFSPTLLQIDQDNLCVKLNRCCRASREHQLRFLVCVWRNWVCVRLQANQICYAVLCIFSYVAAGMDNRQPQLYLTTTSHHHHHHHHRQRRGHSHSADHASPSPKSSISITVTGSSKTL